jgi:hypothetical protein
MEVGFRPSGDDPAFVRRTRVLPFIHRGTGMPLDVVLAGSGLEDEFLERARAAEIGGTTVPLIAPEDLVIAKVLAGRPKDIEDARNLWHVRGRELDADRIRATLQLLEEALSQSDLLRRSRLFGHRHREAALARWRVAGQLVARQPISEAPESRAGLFAP